MGWSETINLVKMKRGTDADGYRVDNVESRREVFADVLSTTRTEFYAAQQAGTDIAKVFKIRAVDYKSERIVEYTHEGDKDPTIYEVKRDYTSGGEFYMLYCSLSSTPSSVGRKRAT